MVFRGARVGRFTGWGPTTGQGGRDRTRKRAVGARRRRAVALVGAAGLALVAVPGLASAAKSPLSEGLSFYRAKTITFIDPSAPGGGFDTWSRLVAPYLAQYLHATINIENVPAGDTIVGQDALAHAPADGLTVGWISPGIDVEIALSNTPGLNFNPVREAFIGSTEPNLSALLSRNAPGCPTTMDALLAATRSGSPSSMLLETVGVTDEFSRLFNVAFGLHLKLIGGYVNTAAIVQGFTRGDGCLVESNLASVGSLLAAGQAVPLVVIGIKNPGLTDESYLAAAPSLQAVIAKYGPTIKDKAARQAQSALLALTPDTGDVLAEPSATAPYKVEAMRAAFAWTMRNPTFRAAALKQGETPGLIPGATAKEQYFAGLKAGAPVAADLS